MITGKTKLFGLIGNPIEHSYSPQLHNTISRILGIDAVYIPMRVEKDNLEKAVKGLSSLGFSGFNVTIPHKEEIKPYINEISNEAELFGAINTVKNKDEKLIGYNTDADGFYRSLCELATEGVAGKEVVVLGAGGAARTIALKLAIENVGKVYVLNRTLKKAQDISDVINLKIRNCSQAMDYDNEALRDTIKKCNIIINATPLGMYPDVDKSPLDGTIQLSRNQMVFDTIYNPSETKLLQYAKINGCESLNGLKMLFYQGICAYEIWNDFHIPSEFVNEIYNVFTENMV